MNNAYCLSFFESSPFFTKPEKPTLTQKTMPRVKNSSEGSKSSTHYLSNTNRFDISSEGPSSGTSVCVGGGGGGGRGKYACFYTSEYIKTTRDKIKTNQKLHDDAHRTLSLI